MKKGTINAYDAYALLNRHKLYPDQLRDVLIDEIGSKKIACISDTMDLLVPPGEETTSIAHIIETANLGPQLKILQTDYKEFKYLSDEDFMDWDHPRFGAHLPQTIQQSRREYVKVDSTQQEDFAAVNGSDVILGRNCICACKGNGRLCGGISQSVDAQQTYLESLISANPNLVVLSASSTSFEDCEDKSSAQVLFRQAKENMRVACEKLNRKFENTYQFALIETCADFAPMLVDPKMENGYMIVACNTNKLDFQPTTTSLEDDRKKKKEKMDNNREQNDDNRPGSGPKIL